MLARAGAARRSLALQFAAHSLRIAPGVEGEAALSRMTAQGTWRARSRPRIARADVGRP